MIIFEDVLFVNIGIIFLYIVSFSSVL